MVYDTRDLIGLIVAAVCLALYYWFRSKHYRYAKYLVCHKWFVFLAGLKTGAPLWRLIIHDWSKFLPCEWMPYARYFYGSYPRWDAAKIQCPGYSWNMTKEGIAASFDRAWLHHQHFNPHHWQHWILREDSGDIKFLPIPEKFWREMIADWLGTGRAITGKWEADKWYIDNRSKIYIEQLTRSRAEFLLAEVAEELRGEKEAQSGVYVSECKPRRVDTDRVQEILDRKPLARGDGKY